MNTKLIEMRDAKAKSHLEQYAPIWLTDEKITPEDDSPYSTLFFNTTYTDGSIVGIITMRSMTFCTTEDRSLSPKMMHLPFSRSMSHILKRRLPTLSILMGANARG